MVDKVLDFLSRFMSVSFYILIITCGIRVIHLAITQNKLWIGFIGVFIILAGFNAWFVERYGYKIDKIYEQLNKETEDEVKE